MGAPKDTADPRLNHRFAQAGADHRSEIKNTPPSQSIELADAVRLFDTWADRADLANNILYEGCHARAHVQCREIEAAGYKAKQVWAIRDPDSESFILLGRHAEKEKVNGEYHTAPAIPVQFPDGRVEDMIFDTTLADGPMTAKEWRSALGLCPDGDILKYDMVDFGQSPLRYHGDYHPLEKKYSGPDTAAAARATLDGLREKNEKEMEVGGLALQRSVYATAARQEAREADPQIPLSGQTWFSGRIIDDTTVQQDTKPNLQQWLGAKFSRLFK